MLVGKYVLPTWFYLSLLKNDSITLRRICNSEKHTQAY